MFNNMRSEVRNLLLVASELGGEAAQYVKVLRVEKEKLLPLDAVQAEMEELKAQVEQASAAEANMFKALTKANDRVQVAEKNAASCKGLLELTREKLATLQVTNDEYKEQLARQAEELELMQANRVHAEVYQNVAAERDRALAELRTQEQAFQKELNKQHADPRECQQALAALSGDLTQSHTALVREQAARAERERERKELTNLRLTLTQRDIELGVLSNVSLELKKAEDKLSRVAAALDAPVRSSTYIDYPGVDIIVAAVRAPVREAMKDE